ncbi:RNA polymerase sigma factor [Pedobacter sp. GR22-6]|uniref:RNA polymerase sigma factor n=1 Tax=Pedobacter sp. GR22-6 TaxID=3127957 RepID=UPI00307E5769
MINQNFQEIELTLLLKKGDKNAFAKLYDLYKQPLTANLFKLLKSEELTFDILQDLFLKIWENREQIDPDKSFRAYLFRIAENMVYDYYRRAARDSKMQLDIMQTSTEIYSYIEEDLLIRENSALLREAVALMPPQRRQVFTLCKLEGKSYKEVEQLMGINPKTINSHLFQASKFLKAHFNKNSGLSAIVFLSTMFKNL